MEKTTKSNPKNNIRQKKYVAFFTTTLMLMTMSSSVGNAIIGILLPEIANAYALSGTQQGLLSAFYSAGALMALFSSLFLQQLWTKPKILCLGVGLLGLATCLQIIPLPFALFLCIGLLMGVGYGFMDTFLSSFNCDLNREKQKQFTGLLHGFFSVGGLLAPLLLRGLLGMMPWRNVYVVTGLFIFVVGVLFFCTSVYMRDKVDAGAHVEEKLTCARLKSFFQKRGNLLWIICGCFNAAGQNGVMVWVVRYVKDGLGDAQTAALCLSVFWMTTTVARFIMPRLPIRSGVVYTSGAILSAVSWGIGILWARPMGMLIASAFTGLFCGAYMPLLISEGVSRNPEGTGLPTTVIMIGMNLARLLMPICVGALISAFDLQSAMLLTSAVFVMAFLLGLLLMHSDNKGLSTKTA